MAQKHVKVIVDYVCVIEELLIETEKMWVWANDYVLNHHPDRVLGQCFLNNADDVLFITTSGINEDPRNMWC